MTFLPKPERNGHMAQLLGGGLRDLNQYDPAGFRTQRQF